MLYQELRIGKLTSMLLILLLGLALALAACGGDAGTEGGGETAAGGEDCSVANLALYEDGKLTVDGNHPLAGKTAKFTVNVLSIRDATPDEIKHGVNNDHINMPVH